LQEVIKCVGHEFIQTGEIFGKAVYDATDRIDVKKSGLGPDDPGKHLFVKVLGSELAEDVEYYCFQKKHDDCNGHDSLMKIENMRRLKFTA
jgi:hypothetical protein